MQYILVGLGNPEDTYQKTYHNAGRLCVEYLADGQPFDYNSAAKCYTAMSEYGILVLPNMAMNNSGQAIQKFLAYTNHSWEQLVIFQDDTDIALGAYKMQTNRGSGGHHGIDSIFAHVGTQNIGRVRIGIRPERFQSNPANTFVLKPIAKADWSSLERVFTDIKTELDEGDVWK